MRLLLASVPLATGLVARTAAPVRPPTSLKVSYLSEVEDADKKKKYWEEDGYNEYGDKNYDNLPSDPRAHTNVGEADANGVPLNYDGFIDAEGFDGGDGQVGVIGDGKNAMEEYDMNQAVEVRRKNMVGGSESKLNAKNAWGTSTGYAEELKKKGMVEYNEYGEDVKQQKRQQLENWRNQQELRIQKDGQMKQLADLQGKEYQAINHGSYLAQFDKKPADMDIIAGNRDTFVADTLVAGDAMGVLACKATLNGRGGTTLTIKNEFSTYDDFVAGFADGGSDAITVEPTSGTLNRRSGEPQEFVIKFQPTAFAPSYEAKLVIETESVKWTYDVVCQLE